MSLSLHDTARNNHKRNRLAESDPPTHPLRPRGPQLALRGRASRVQLTPTHTHTYERTQRSAPARPHEPCALTCPDLTKKRKEERKLENDTARGQGTTRPQQIKAQILIACLYHTITISQQYTYRTCPSIHDTRPKTSVTWSCVFFCFSCSSHQRKGKTSRRYQ